MNAKKRSYAKSRKSTTRTRRSNRRRNRRFGNRRPYRSGLTMINYSKSLIAPRYFTKMEWSKQGAINFLVPVSPIVYQQYALNGLAIPDATQAPHQPMGWDQIFPLYYKYRVHGVRVKVTGTIVPAATGNTVVALIMGSYTGLTTAYPTDLSTAEEDRMYRVAYYDANKGPIRYTQYFPCHTTFGQTKMEYRMEDDYVGVGTANPIQTGAVNVGVCSLQTGLAPPEVNLQVHLTYLVEWFSPRNVGQS